MNVLYISVSCKVTDLFPMQTNFYPNYEVKNAILSFPKSLILSPKSFARKTKPVLVKIISNLRKIISNLFLITLLIILPFSISLIIKTYFVAIFRLEIPLILGVERVGSDLHFLMSYIKILTPAFRLRPSATTTAAPV